MSGYKHWEGMHELWMIDRQHWSRILVNNDIMIQD